MNSCYRVVKEEPLPDIEIKDEEEKQKEEDRLIEERRKRRMAILNKYKETSTTTHASPVTSAGNLYLTV